MVGAGVLWGLAGGMLFSLILPFGGLIWMRKRFCRSVKPFFIGMAVFAVFQLRMVPANGTNPLAVQPVPRAYRRHF